MPKNQVQSFKIGDKVFQPLESCETTSEIRKWIYSAIRNCEKLPRSLNPYEKMAAFINVIDNLYSVTPSTLLDIFPPSKIYDGEQFQTKDYFSTMEAIKEFGYEAPLGEKVFDFFWDYVNPHIQKFTVNYMSAMSGVLRANGEMGLMEGFLAQSNIPSYVMTTMPDGHEMLYNAKTGTCQIITKPKSQIPRWWRIIEGGAHP